MLNMIDVYERAARAIVGDRNFNAASASYVEAFVTWRRTRGNFNRAGCSSARQRVLRSIFWLHFTNNAAHNPDTGATFERLLLGSNPDTKSSSFGPRVVRNVIMLAEHTGHLMVREGRHDRRLKIVIPTDKWIEQAAGHHEVALASLALLEQNQLRFAARPRGRTLVARLAIEAGKNQDAVGVVLGDPDAAMRDIADCHGGLSMTFALADAWIRGKRIPSPREIAESFSFSASQVRKILRLAAERGLIALERGGKITDASVLVEAIRRLVAHEFTIYLRCFAPPEPIPADPFTAVATTAERRRERV